MIRTRLALATARQPLWVAAGVIAVMVGSVGAVLPVLPTTPFVILGAVCLGRGSPRLAQRLERHRVFGPAIADWRAHGAIAPRGKAVAHLMMGAALIVSLLAGVPGLVLALQAICLLAASFYILSRPNGGRDLREPGAFAAPARSPRPCGARQSGDSPWTTPSLWH
ncbi:YbaN family protein [Dinoroseobacter shibae]|nr:YbaN family protein [Dinoroseobacter shibae]URF47189.1 YbaN family protein [Dinoroseobacter shibae]URF51500.1 YbaN family protein [Dinoroseobacter shibae]